MKINGLLQYCGGVLKKKFVKFIVQDLTSGGLDWQREKWKSGFGSKFIRQGEKNAVKYDDKTRTKSASGGVATELAKTFIKKGGKVCSCLFRDGNFVFDIVEDTNKLDCFAGSKYIKSNPTNIYKTIKKELAKETEILFIGLPCQVAALRNYIGDPLSEKLTTIDLICHGTPSPKILDIFLKQYDENTCKMSSIDFRVKGNFRAFCHPW